MAQLKLEIGSSTVTLTCSLGVSQWEPGDTIDRLLKRADMGLYQAKVGGRNRVVVADDGPATMDYGDGANFRAAVVRRVVR